MRVGEDFGAPLGREGGHGGGEEVRVDLCGCGRVAHLVVPAHGGGGEPFKVFGEAGGMELAESGGVPLLEGDGGVFFGFSVGGGRGVQGAAFGA